MDKIVKIEGDKVFIGRDDGGLIEADVKDCNFTPSVNDYVEIFRSENSIVISKAQNMAAEIKDSVMQAIYSADGKKPVNKIAYAVLAIFLGSFGVHKFYSGKTGLGILYLLFCWSTILGIIGFIEGIFALFKPADENGNIVV